MSIDKVNEASSWPLPIGMSIHFGRVDREQYRFAPAQGVYRVRAMRGLLREPLEAFNKYFEPQLLISSAVCEQLGEAGLDAQSLEQLAIKGSDRPTADSKRKRMDATALCYRGCFHRPCLRR
jgi:adenylate cyclase